jgi:hypothetical protein
MIPAYLRVRTMGVGMESIHHEYIQLMVQMVFYFCTAAAALYVSAWRNAKQRVSLYLNSEIGNSIPSEDLNHID